MGHGSIAHAESCFVKPAWIATEGETFVPIAGLVARNILRTAGVSYTSIHIL